MLVLSETWMDERGWVKVRERLPRGYKWAVQLANRKNRKERPMGGMIIGIRKEMMKKGVKMETGRKGLMVGMVKSGKERWRIVGVHVGKGGMGRVLQDLEKWVGHREEGNVTIVGGDFNARIEKGW